MNHKNPHFLSVLVTGGAGFIGSHLTEALVHLGYHVHVVDNLSNGSLDNLQAVIDDICFHRLDINSPAFLDMLMKRDFAAVFHFAANAYVPPSVANPEYDFKTNLLAPFHILEILRKVELSGIFITASSAAVYGNPQYVPITEDMPTFPISPYGVSKLSTERYVAVYSQLYGIKAAELRLFSVFGPRQRKQIVYDFMQKITGNSRELTILGDGTQVRDMVYVEDVVQAALTVFNNAPLAGEVYNVATGKGLSTAEIANTVCRVMHQTPDFKYTGDVRPGDCQQWIANIDRLSQLGFKPRFSFEEGIQRTFEWFQSAHQPTSTLAHSGDGSKTSGRL